MSDYPSFCKNIKNMRKFFNTLVKISQKIIGVSDYDRKNYFMKNKKNWHHYQ